MLDRWKEERGGYCGWTGTNGRELAGSQEGELKEGTDCVVMATDSTLSENGSHWRV